MVHQIAIEFGDKLEAPVLPVAGKAPKGLPQWQKKSREYLASNKHKGWNNADGFGVRLDNHTVVDIDKVDMIDEVYQALGIEEGESLTVSTPSGGIHIYFSGTVPAKSEAWGELKSGNGHQVVGPNGEDRVILYDREPLPVPPQLYKERARELANLRKLPQDQCDEEPKWHLICRAYKEKFGSDPVVKEALRDWSSESDKYDSKDWEAGGWYDRLSTKAREGSFTLASVQAIVSKRESSLDKIGSRSRRREAGESGLLVSMKDVMTEKPFKAEPILSSDDGQIVIPYALQTNIYGEGGLGKTFIMGALIKQMKKNDRVVYMYYDGPNREVATVVEKLGGCKYPEHVAHCRNPGEYNKKLRKEILAFLGQGKRGTVIIDTVDRAGGGGYSSEEYLEWHKYHVLPYREAGYAVILIDHEPKAFDNNHQIGSVAKRNATRLQYRLHPKKGVGLVLEKMKDNHGAISQNMFRVKLTRLGEMSARLDLVSAESFEEEQEKHERHEARLHIYTAGHKKGAVLTNKLIGVVFGIEEEKAKQRKARELVDVGAIKAIDPKGRVNQYEVG